MISEDPGAVPDGARRRSGGFPAGRLAIRANAVYNNNGTILYSPREQAEAIIFIA